MHLKYNVQPKTLFIILTLIFFCIFSTFSTLEACCAVRLTKWYGWPLSYMSVGKTFDLMDPEFVLADKMSFARRSNLTTLLGDGWEFYLSAPVAGLSDNPRPYPFDSTILSIVVDLFVSIIFAILFMGFGYIAWFMWIKSKEMK